MYDEISLYTRPILFKWGANFLRKRKGWLLRLFTRNIWRGIFAATFVAAIITFLFRKAMKFLLKSWSKRKLEKIFKSALGAFCVEFSYLLSLWGIFQGDKLVRFIESLV